MKIFKVSRKTTVCEIWEVASTREHSYKVSISLVIFNLINVSIREYYMVYTRLASVPTSLYTVLSASTTNACAEVVYKYIYKSRL